MAVLSSPVELPTLPEAIVVTILVKKAPNSNIPLRAPDKDWIWIWILIYIGFGLWSKSGERHFIFSRWAEFYWKPIAVLSRAYSKITSLYINIHVICYRWQEETGLVPSPSTHSLRFAGWLGQIHTTSRYIPVYVPVYIGYIPVEP